MTSSFGSLKCLAQGNYPGHLPTKSGALPLGRAVHFAEAVNGYIVNQHCRVNDIKSVRVDVINHNCIPE